MDKRDQAYQDYINGMKYKDIAEKYQVSISCVKSWASREWNKRKVATKKRKAATKKQKKVATEKKKRGAPKGNKNAVGNSGGVPRGTQNALKHGGYSEVYWDTLSDEEKTLIDDMPISEEILLIDQLKLLSVRERRLMAAINKCLEAKGELVVSRTSSSKKIRDFPSGAAGDEERALYEQIRQGKINEGKISYLGHDKYIVTDCESSYDRIIRLERELTAVQAKKTKCIEALARLHKESMADGGLFGSDGAASGSVSGGVDVGGADIVNIYLPDNGRD